MALANVTEGAARSTVLKVTQVEPSYGLVAWQALAAGGAPKLWTDPALAPQPTLATLKRCKDPKEWKERRTAWPSRVAEHEHQLRTIDDAQKTFVVREMMPKDIKRGFLTGPKKLDEIIEKLDIIINEMMADDGPVPMDLVSVGTHDARTTKSDQDASNDVSYDDVCAIAWRGDKAGRGAGKTGPNGAGTWHRGKGADERTTGRGDDGGKKQGKKGSKDSKPDWHGDRDKGSTGNKGKGKSKTRYCYDVGMNCPYKWTNSIDEEEDQGSSRESELEGEKEDEPASLEAPGPEGEWCWSRRNRITRWGKRMDPGPAFHCRADDEDEPSAWRIASSGPTVDVEESHSCSRLGGSGERDAEEHVPRDVH